jgi:hypothetical protein
VSATSPSSARNNSASPKPPQPRRQGVCLFALFLFSLNIHHHILCCTIFPYGTASYHASYDFAYGAIRSNRMHHTGVGIQSFYLLVTFIFYRSFFAFLITLWTFWHALHARESFFTACRPPTHSPCSPVSDGIDDVQRRKKSCPSIGRERAKTQRDSRSVYPTTSLSSLRVCFLAFVCLFWHLLEVIAMESRTRGVYT